MIDNGRTMGQKRTQVQLIDTWTLLLGSHELRTGFEYRRLTSASTPARDSLTYQFSNIDQAIKGLAGRITVQRIQPMAMHRDVWSAFWQDTVRIRHLTVTFGLRAGVTPAPVSTRDGYWRLVQPDALPIPTAGPPWKTWTTVAPSLAGMYAIDKTEGRGTVVRAGWGRTYDVLAVPGASVFARSSATRSILFAPFPAAPTDLQASEPFIPSDINFAFPSNLRAPRTDTLHVGLERAIGHKQQLDISYVRASGVDQLYWYAVADHPNRYGVSNQGRSRYNGLLVQFTRRASERGMVLVAYTLSHALDNDSGESPSPNLSPTLIQPARNWGSADYDQRHSLSFVASYRLPAPRGPALLRTICADVDLDITGTARSGVPIGVTVPIDFGTGPRDVRPDLVPGVPAWIDDLAAGPQHRRLNPNAFIAPAGQQGALPRNIFRAPAVYQFDLGMKKSIRLRGPVKAELRIRVYNIFNRANAGRPVSDLGSSRFGQTLRSYADDLGTGTLVHGGLDSLRQVGGSRAVRGEIRVTF